MLSRIEGSSSSSRFFLTKINSLEFIHHSRGTSMPGMFPIHHLPREQIDSAAPHPSPLNGFKMKIRDFWGLLFLGIINGQISAESEGENLNYSRCSPEHRELEMHNFQGLESGKESSFWRPGIKRNEGFGRLELGRKSKFCRLGIKRNPGFRGLESEKKSRF